MHAGATVLAAGAAHRGRLIGLVFGIGQGTGIAPGPVLAHYLVEQLGWRTALALAGIVVTAFALLTLRAPSPPLGAPPPAASPWLRSPAPRGAGRTIPLVGFFVGKALLAVYDESVYQHGYAFGLALGLSGAGAAGVIAVASIAYVVGTIGGGSLSDVVGRRPVLVVAALGSATALVGFVHSSAETVGYWAGLFGLLLGASAATRSAAWTDTFAGPRLGRDVGIVAAGYPVGAAVLTYGGAA